MILTVTQTRETGRAGLLAGEGVWDVLNSELTHLLLPASPGHKVQSLSYLGTGVFSRK